MKYINLFFEHVKDSDMPPDVEKDRSKVNRKRSQGQYDGFVFAIEIFITIVLLILIYLLTR